MPLNSNTKETHQAKKRPKTLPNQKTKNFLLLIWLIAVSQFMTTGMIFDTNQYWATTAGATSTVHQLHCAISANFRKAKNITDKIATRLIFENHRMMSMRSMAG